MPAVSPWTRCLSTVHLSNAAQVAVLTFNPHWWSLQSHSRLQTPNPLSGDNKMLSYFIGICQRMTKRNLCVSTEILGKKRKSCGSEWVWMCWLSLSLLFIRGRSAVAQGHRGPFLSGVQVASSCHLYSIVLYSFQTFCLQRELSHWMVNFSSKHYFLHS